MISTHTPKIFNARLKQSALRSRIRWSKLISPLPKTLICSQNVKMRRELWAAPQNAANMPEFREAIANLDPAQPFTCEIPGISDPQLKQILVPRKNWRQGAYVSTTPVASMGVNYEIFKRLQEHKLPFRRWVIQPTAAAMPNHGESMIAQSGTVRMFRRGIAEITPGNWTGSFVQLLARVEGMNISSGMAAVGWPAMTAIGGLVHALERKTGADIQFAFGMSDCQWKSGVPKITTFRTSRGSTTGRSSGKVTPVPGYVTEEITANAQIILLLRSEPENLQKIAQAAKEINRIAGGSVFEPKVDIIFNDKPAPAAFLIDASLDIERATWASDPLDAALKMYGKDGEWKAEKFFQPRNGYTINMNGYAFLEEPQEREASRNNYPHVWSEPVFSLVTQGSLSQNGWWHRRDFENAAIWTGV